jgi:hypothetical protein
MKQKSWMYFGYLFTWNIFGDGLPQLKEERAAREQRPLCSCGSQCVQEMFSDVGIVIFREGLKYVPKLTCFLKRGDDLGMGQHDVPQHGVLEHPNVVWLVGWFIYWCSPKKITKNSHLVHLDAGSVVPGVRWDLVGVPASMKKQVVPAARWSGGQGWTCVVAGILKLLLGLLW